MAPPPDLDDLLRQRVFPEQTLRESAVIHDWLVARGAAYDRIDFSVRVGLGQPIPEGTPEGIARMIRFSSRKRIDVVAWQAGVPTLIEVKERITPGVLGQLRAYLQLWQEDHPDGDPPRLLAIGRFSDDDTLRVLAAEGVDVLLYEPEG